MSTADWHALAQLAALVIVPVIWWSLGITALTVVLYLAVCAVRLAWRRLAAWHRRGMARLARLADAEQRAGVRYERLERYFPNECADPPCSFEDGWSCSRHQVVLRG